MKYLSEIFEVPISGEWGNESDGSGVKVIRTTNFTNYGQLDLDKGIAVREISEAKIHKKKLQYGDSIIEKSGGSPDQPVGRAVFFHVENNVYLCNNFTAILRPKREYHPKFCFYVLYYLYNNKAVIKYQNKTTGIINLKLNDYLKGTRIFIPPFKIQQKIADVLDKAQALIDKRKEQLEKLDELVQSVFYEMFGDPVRNEKGWNQTSITNVCHEIVDCVNKTAPQVDVVTPYKMIRTSNVRNGKISFDNIKYVDKTTFEKWTRRSVPQQGDILLTREAPMGAAGIVDFDDAIFLGQRIMQYRCNHQLVNPLYLLHFMHEKCFQNQIERLGKGSTVKHLAVPDCYNLNVLTPPIDLQNQFAHFVEKTEQQKALMQQSLIEMENNFNSIMQRAFKGELF